MVGSWCIEPPISILKVEFFTLGVLSRTKVPEHPLSAAKPVGWNTDS